MVAPLPTEMCLGLMSDLLGQCLQILHADTGEFVLKVPHQSACPQMTHNLQTVH